jgi:hypothetical protein
MSSVSVGPELFQILSIAYKANVPALLYGCHGNGKSEGVIGVAKALGIDHRIVDLSLLEPPDLIGIPQVIDGRTVYAPPSWLPHDGKGLLLIEELNRSPRYMVAPCLQLLTARRLNDYHLPPGWLPCAAINDAADGYDVYQLDEAVLSRFVRIKVVSEVEPWVEWATEHGVHDKIRTFVSQSPGIFNDPVANPRAWFMASKILREWEQTTREESTLSALLAGIVGDTWALAFLRVYGNHRRPLQPAEILENYPVHRGAVAQWIADGHLDVVASSMENLKRHIQPQRIYDEVIDNPSYKANIESFLAHLPGDLKRQMQEWLEDRGFDELTIAAPPAPRIGRRKRP